MKKINIFRKKGQGTAEYAILIGLVVAAAVAMQTYVKRGMQGRIYDASRNFYNSVKTANWTAVSTVVPDMSVTAGVGEWGQYEPLGLSSQSTQKIVVGQDNTPGEWVDTKMEVGGKVTRQSIHRTEQAAGDYQQQAGY